MICVTKSHVDATKLTKSKWILEKKMYLCRIELEISPYAFRPIHKTVKQYQEAVIQPLDVHFVVCSLIGTD